MGCTGRSQQLFVCVFSHFRHGDERTTKQPGDPSASLLLTSVRRQSFAIQNFEDVKLSNVFQTQSSQPLLIERIMMV